MIVKRYYVDEMSEAMGIIRAELGPDAVILSSKPVRQKGIMGYFKKRQFEVMAAYEPRLESPKTREERENAAYAAATRAAAAQREQKEQAPPVPGRPIGPVRPAQETPAAAPAATAAVRVAEAYRRASFAGSPSQGPSHPDPQDKELKSAQEALAAALAAKQEAAVREKLAQAAAPPPPPPPPVEPSPQEVQERQAEQMRREQERFIPYSPPEMVVTPPQRQESETPSQLELLDQKLTAMAAMMDRLAAPGERPLTQQGKSRLEALVNADVEGALARSLVEEAEEVAPRIGGDLGEALFRLVLRELRDTKPLSFEKGQRRVLLFMGPTGVGKTTTLVKLATMCSVRQGLKVGMINTDTYRIAAQEQLKIYADILGVTQSVVYSPEEMREALELMQDRDVVFVDTAGKRPGDEQHVSDMRALVEAAQGEAQVLLCVAATTSPRALREVVRHYSFLEDYGLVVTKTDETQGIGAALNACAFSEKSLCYTTRGQSVPDDIEEADARAIARRILG